MLDIIMTVIAMFIMALCIYLSMVFKDIIDIRRNDKEENDEKK